MVFCLNKKKDFIGLISNYLIKVSIRIFSIQFILILKQTSINCYYLDEQVEPCPEEEIVTENAYILFYERRENKGSNQN